MILVISTAKPWWHTGCFSMSGHSIWCWWRYVPCVIW